MTAPGEVIELIERFDRNRESYLSGQYNETQLRREFLDPFFSALGWDVDNKQGYAEAYKDVIHEDALKIGGAMKAPDYCFRIGGIKKFFVEAKKPSINLKEEVNPAFQLRRYAWSAKLPLSILTDFEEFAVYDCRIKPAQMDKASIGRVLYMTYKDYQAKWDELVSIFSRDAILKGSFDKYAESSKLKKGTATVDAAFLSEIEDWRDLLARNIALRNAGLSQRELNFAVQRTIDRIVFLRICEDRGIEEYGRLQVQLNGTNVYRRLLQLFTQADDRYNSGLFHFQREKDRHEEPDNLTPNISIDDKPLKDIIRRLYYPESPYEFSVLSADILGQVYEQFLGKVIRLTAGHQARVEEKPEVRKAGGVYYTPTYIVDYIVKNTVGKLLDPNGYDEAVIPAKAGIQSETLDPRLHEDDKPKKTMTPKDVSKIRILDPACGSGSFLLGAYQHLLDWHLRWYIENDPEKWAKAKQPPVYQGPSLDPSIPNWHLTTTEKKRILLNNIYGVDIDSQAVEVTKLSLLLKVLEGENSQTLAAELRLFHQRALPDLGDNIKCGNSLIGSDFYQQQLLLDDEERLRINVFDWEKEFPTIMNPSHSPLDKGGRKGGFDVVIGNPPYLRIQGLQEHHSAQVDYFLNHYQSAVKRFDLYLLFIEKGFKLLTTGGYLGYICPHKFTNSDFGSGLRSFLVMNTAIDSLVSFGNNLVFKAASTYTGILILSKTKKHNFDYCEFPAMPHTEMFEKLFSLSKSDYAQYQFTTVSAAPWILTHSAVSNILAHISQPKSLGDIFAEILVGVQSGIDNIHVLKFVSNKSKNTIKLFSTRADDTIEVEKEIVKPFLTGEDVHRYAMPEYSHYCIYPYKLNNDKTVIIEERELRNDFPLAYSYLNKFRKELTEIRIRQKTNATYWFSCHRSRDMRVFETERILTPEISFGCNMTRGLKGFYHNTQVYSLVPKETFRENILYWLGLLNSQLLWYFMKNTGTVLRGGYVRFKTEYLKPFPTKTIDFSNQVEKSRHDKMVSLVDQMLTLNERLPEVKTDHEKTALQRQIDATDHQIDELVYELYGLTEEEIRIVEGGDK